MASDQSSEARAEADMSLAAIEAQADIWAARIDLSAMIRNVTNPVYLTRGAPDDVREGLAKRMREQVDAIVRQAFIEGAVLAEDGFVSDEEIHDGQ